MNFKNQSYGSTSNESGMKGLNMLRDTRNLGYQTEDLSDQVLKSMETQNEQTRNASFKVKCPIIVI